LITPIEEAWANQAVALSTYRAGSDGPTEADTLPARDGRRWRRLSETVAGCD
jgi:glucose-6-phosphate 1-dehydrogenase